MFSVDIARRLARQHALPHYRHRQLHRASSSSPASSLLFRPSFLHSSLPPLSLPAPPPSLFPSSRPPSKTITPLHIFPALDIHHPPPRRQGSRSG
eukprot:2310942-Rhodomonas_salina.1